MAVSQKQVAERLGVSIALVSRVLSGKAEEIGIAPETIERVARTAREMGYVPNAAALALKGKSSHTIGVAVYDFNDPFFGALIQTIQALAHRHGYSLVLAGFLNRVPDERDLLALHKHSIDSLLVLGSDTRAEWLADFRHLPIARIGHGGKTEHSVRVTIDETDAARKLVGHLATTGRKRLAYVSGVQPAGHPRRHAIERAAAEAGLDLRPAVSRLHDPFAAGGRMAAALIREKGADGPDALVCASDQVAMGALHTLAEAGRKVPDEVAVTGFDDIPLAARFIPPITTVRQPLDAMVAEAFRHFVDPRPPEVLSLPGKLVVRRTA